MSEIDRLEAYIERLRAQVADLQAHREEEHTRMLAWRGIDVAMGDVVCGRCGGAGTRTYGSTATWHGGIGGQAMTLGICDHCWGSGVGDKPWLNLRSLKPQTPQEVAVEAISGSVSAPEPGSVWTHKSGRRYLVVLLANEAADADKSDEWPVTVVYKDGEGRTWSRPLSRWHASFHPTALEDTL